MRELEVGIKRFLVSKGCVVGNITQVKVGRANVGCNAIWFCLEGFWGFLEVKASKGAKFQPLQKDTLAKLDVWSYAKAVYPENWDEIKLELGKLLT